MISHTYTKKNISKYHLDIVDWLFGFSCTLLPGTVSITTKSMGDSELRPIWKKIDN